MTMITLTADKRERNRVAAQLDSILANLKLEKAKAKSDSLRQIEALDDELAAQYALATGANPELATCN